MMKRQKWEQFEELVLAIQNQWGTTALYRGQEPRKRELQSIPTGFTELDALTGIGGIPTSDSSLFLGASTSGVTTLAYTIAAQAQQAGHVVVYFDLTQTLDPSYAADCGVDVQRLLIAHASDWLQGLNMLRDVIALPYQGLAVFDGLAPHWLVTQHIHDLAAALKRMRVVISQSNWTLLVLLPRVLPFALDEYVAMTLVAEMKEWVYEHGDVIGYQVALTITRNKFQPAGQSTIVTISLKGDV